MALVLSCGGPGAPSRAGVTAARAHGSAHGGAVSARAAARADACAAGAAACERAEGDLSGVFLGIMDVLAVIPVAGL